MRIHRTQSACSDLSKLRYTQVSPEDRKGLCMDLDVGRKWKHRPVGLWYGFGEDWMDHLKENYADSPLLDQYQGSAFIIEPNSTCRILTVQSPQDIHKLHERFPEVVCDDWRRLAEAYDGLEVIGLADLMAQAENDEMIQEHLSWLGPLEIDSGCIWDLSKVEISLQPDVEIAL